ncbi:MAG: synthase [Clostridia bacterium]|nr:synthase [Clostridia bacterium]
MDAQQVVSNLVNWLREQTESAGARGAVVGLSGGVDSAVTAALCKRAFPENTLGVIMPCHSNPQDAEHARLVACKIHLPTVTVILDQVYDALLEQLTKNEPHTSKVALANLKPRLRMLTLYYFANARNYLVVGTGNRSELAVGYFTKYGDGGVDLLPLGNLVKAQVRELAYFLEIPEEIITKAPSAGLWEGQTDEGEMGLTYAELDRYLLTGQARPEVESKIKDMAARSQHKKSLPSIPPIF